jgi:uncharacterized protein YcaQ
MLHQLQAQDRRVFEWWTHAASYLPMADYRYYLPRMRAHARRGRTRRWLEENQDLAAHVLERIRAEGPLGSADFQAPEGFERGSWWSWKPAKRALEALFDTGQLMVAERRNFQRIYDLRERVLPPDADLTEPDREQVQRFIARRAVGGQGIAFEGDVRWGRQKADSGTLRRLVGDGEVISFEVEGFDDQVCYAMSEAFEQVAESEASANQLHILSPFDNLVIRRGWLAKLYGFDYKLEAYTPASERKHGYFALPMLWGQEFVGRVDCKADRRSSVLIVRQLTFEPGYVDRDGLVDQLAVRLWEFAAFNGCREVSLEGVVPREAKGPLACALEKGG